MLIAPLGASAVLIFAIPASPLAQPWPVIGGDLLSAMVGLAAGMLLGHPVFSAAAGVCAAIAVMTITRCLHPPGGACALLCALGATGTETWDFSYMLPISANVLSLVLVGWIYNNFTGHRWPHVQYPVPRRTMHFPHPGTYRRSDIEEVLSDWDEVLDIDIDDLDAVFRAVERKAAKRRTSEKSKSSE
ncbi:MAG: HPP family protein [Novosphingobium sp.]|uniref:HPP family protein n=1 Tax=Novosphingobium sp. TaxID=1874826 RepID=UPI003371744B|nr:HPP family protein [Novosphingobium sp.]